MAQVSRTKWPTVEYEGTGCDNRHLIYNNLTCFLDHGKALGDNLNKCCPAIVL